MFGETTIFYAKVWNHPTETTIKKLMFRVPGRSFLSFSVIRESPKPPTGKVSAVMRCFFVFRFILHSPTEVFYKNKTPLKFVTPLGVPRMEKLRRFHHPQISLRGCFSSGGPNFRGCWFETPETGGKANHRRVKLSVCQEAGWFC